MQATLKHAVRTILRNRLTSLVVILSIGLGIGLNVTIFSVLNAVLLRPVQGVVSPKSLMNIFTTFSGGMTFGAVSYPDYADWAARNSVFESLLAQTMVPVSLNREGGNNVLTGALVTGNYFEGLGVKAFRGHFFTVQEAPVSSSTPLVVISNGLWKRNFAASRDIVGQTVRLNSRSMTVVGVAPPDFVGADLGLPVDVWIPMNMQPFFVPDPGLLKARGSRWLEVIGRLRPGVTKAQAQERMNGLANQLGQEYPDSNAHTQTTVVPLGQGPDSVQSNLSLVITVLMCAAVLVLFIACFNVANLLLSRASSRWAEMGLRMALGADWRVPIELLLSESLLLCLLGGIAGVGLAYACTSAMSSFNPPTSLPLHLQLSPDPTVLLVALFISILCGVIVGTVPGIQATRTDPIVMFKGVKSSPSRKTAWFRNALVIAQVTISTLLLVSAGLLIQSVLRARQADLGFKSDHLDLASIDVGFAGYDQAKGEQAYREILQRVSTIPGVASDSLAQLAQLEVGTTQQMGIFVEAHQQRDLPIDYNVVAPGYFRTLEIALLKGRDFTERDDEHSPRVVIVNEKFAERFFKGQDAVGKEIHLSGPDHPSLQIIGVAKDSRYYNVREDPIPFMFLPFLQNYQSGMVLQVRARGLSSSIFPAIRQQVALVDPAIPVFRARTMEEQVTTSLIELRIGVLLMGVFGSLALILATMGLYAVMAFSVSRQKGQIAVHMAVGASRANVMMMILRRGGILTASGLALGLFLSFPFGTMLSSMLFGIQNADPVVMICVVAVIGFTAFIATILPAWRATLIDPASVLRSE